MLLQKNKCSKMKEKHMKQMSLLYAGVSFYRCTEYAHNTKEKLTKMQCLPDSLTDREYYRPAGEGAEAEVKKRLYEIKEWKRTP